MPYRGPQTGRIAAQIAQIQQYAGETGIWRQYVSASTGTGSGYWAGRGTTTYDREQTITALWASPQVGEARMRETQLPGGQVIAGDAVISTPNPFGARDEIVWRGITYRVEGDSTPIHFGGRVWYRTVLRRGDVTG